jgi:hypothetical protein
MKIPDFFGCGGDLQTFEPFEVLAHRLDDS